MNASASGSTSASANCAPTMMPIAIPSMAMRFRFQRKASRGAYRVCATAIEANTALKTPHAPTISGPTIELRATRPGVKQ